jgi:NAD(P)-dependent dehydrogenase (short-subunit alcohol dehydrogenase family)
MPGSTFLITGCSRGLGLEFVRQLARRGDRVMACARSRECAGAQEATRLAARFGVVDSAAEDSIAAAAEQLRNESIDVLINNAGISSEDRSINDVNMSDFTRVFTANTFGPSLVTRAFLPHLRAGKRRTVVNISSLLGSLSKVDHGFGHAYCASKAALNMLTVRTAQDLAGDGFTVVTISPGWVRTDMGGNEAPLSPEQSISALVRTIDALTPGANGKFLDYDGTPLPW